MKNKIQPPRTYVESSIDSPNIKFPQTYANINVYYQKDIAFLEFNVEDKKVNALSLEVLIDFMDALKILKIRKNLKLLVIESAKKENFIAGADIGEIADITTEKEANLKVSAGQEVMNFISSLPFYTLAIVDGSCMGGGLELLLTCTFRIATDAPYTKFSLPEVKLGIIPAFGGTQRLPLTVGLVNALDMILTGKTISARKALKIKLIHDICKPEYLQTMREIWIKNISENNLKTILKIRNKFTKNFEFLLRPFILSAAKKKLSQKISDTYPAPFIALKVLKNTFRNSTFHNGLAIEKEEFCKLIIRKETKALLNVYYAIKHAKKATTPPADEEQDYQDITELGILGGGAMGAGIAFISAKNNIKTTITDIELTAIKACYNSIKKLCKTLSRRSSTSHETNQTSTKKDTLLNIHGTTDNKELALSDFVLEAIVENLEIKQNTLQDLETNTLRRDTIIATNTSSLSVEQVMSNLKHKDRTIGMHFFNPANKMPLVEIIKTPHTSDETFFKTTQLARKLGKTPVLVGDCSGFAVNRILMPYMNEAVFSFESTFDTKVIDSALKDFGMPLGPFELADKVGIDICQKVAQNLQSSYGNRMAYPLLLDKMVENNFLGEKTDIGFYIPPAKLKGINKLFPTANSKNKIQNEKVLAILNQLLASPASQVPIPEIIDRLICTLINEASRVLEEGIVSTPKALDVIMIMGIGFPAFRGGLLHYADCVGTQKIYNKLCILSDKYGERFTPSNLLLKLSTQKQGFYNFFSHED